MLTLKNVSVSVADKPILVNFSYTFKEGVTYAIMGPNGSGKSTLASAVMGNPLYTLSEESIMKLQGQDIVAKEPHERAQMGLFLSHQSPVSLSGVSLYSLLRHAMGGTLDPVKTRALAKKHAQMLHIKEELMARSLMEDFSGGEKKKMEVLQALILKPTCMFFDEIDTGLDVDALKLIGNAIQTMHTPQTSTILITHYTRLLKYVKPDVVLVLKDGTLVREGDFSLAQQIESDGYDAIV